MAGYGRRLGDYGDLLAAYWEQSCDGTLSFERAPDEATPDYSQDSLTTLEVWIKEKLPGSMPVQLDFKDGEEKPYVAFGNDMFVFHAIANAHGGVGWALGPASALAGQASQSVESTPEAKD